MLEPRLVDPAEAVPSGRLLQDLQGPQLLVYCFLAPAGYAELAMTGTLRARSEHVDPVEPYAYRWMSEQLQLKCGAEPGTLPLWVWAKTTRRQLISDARRYARLEPGTVLVTCRVQRERVLLSEFSDWHCVLNAGLAFPRSMPESEFEAEWDDWCGRFTAAVADSTGPRETWPAEILDELHASWEIIFDVHAYPRRSFWQGCIAELRVDDVVEAVRLATPPNSISSMD